MQSASSKGSSKGGSKDKAALQQEHQLKEEAEVSTTKRIPLFHSCVSLESLIAILMCFQEGHLIPFPQPFYEHMTENSQTTFGCSIGCWNK